MAPYVGMWLAGKWLMVGALPVGEKEEPTGDFIEDWLEEVDNQRACGRMEECFR